ncbi:MAG: hypothetical protein RL291_1742, partial [Pseudomonadota bacterium]
MKPPPPDWQTFQLGDGRTLAYRIYGDPEGRPLMALHGAPATGYIYRIADGVARARGVKIIAPDRPGYGGSSPHPGRTLQTTTADHVALADHLKLDRFPVLGVSGGGPYSVALAAALGERVSSVALVSPVGELTKLPRQAFNNRLHARFFLALPHSRVMPLLTPVARWLMLPMMRFSHRYMHFGL